MRTEGSECVAEMVGLEGGFVFTELMLQRIWLRGRFIQMGAMTLDGRSVRVHFPGRWNHGGGPDFLGARLRLGAEELEGDVEMHLSESDWRAHGHSGDPAYARVVLHVVLFSPKSTCWTTGVSGVSLPILSLLPLLPFDLEEHAIDDAAEELAGRPKGEAAVALLDLSPQECASLLNAQARSRWELKKGHAEARLQLLGWAGACHAGALETLGRRFNCGPMLRLAERHVLEEWETGVLEEQVLFEEELGCWNLRGGRPLNHPLLRIGQYKRWVLQQKGWPRRLSEQKEFLSDGVMLSGWPRGAGRRGGQLSGDQGSGRLSALRERWRLELCAGELSGPRFDSFICDLCLPMLAVTYPETEAQVHQLWLWWFPSDTGEGTLGTLRKLLAGEEGVQVNNNGMQQAYLGWCKQWAAKR